MTWCRLTNVPGASTRVARDIGNYKRLFEIGISVTHFDVHLLCRFTCFSLCSWVDIGLEVNPLT